MEKEGVWLGRFRAPIYVAMLASMAVTGLVFLGLVLGRLFFEDAYGMHEMI